MATAARSVRHDGVARWSPNGGELAIEYSIEVLDSIRAEAVAGLNLLRHGGVEVGGVLFGLRHGSEIRIVKSRAFQSEHALGPGFILSEKDEVDLERLIQEAGADPELKGLQPVGWYRSHTRSGVCLSSQDIGLYDRHFPQPWQIAMVLCPATVGQAEVGFFFRDASGALRSEAPYETFNLLPLQRKPVVTETADVPLALAVGPPPEVALSHPPNTNPQPSNAISQPSNSGRGWVFAFLLLGALVGALAGVLSVLRPSAGDRRTLGLRAIDRDGAVSIEWNRDADFVLASQRALLSILDGGEKSETQLSPELLRNGRLIYYRKSPDIEIRLLVYRDEGGTEQELMRLVGLAPIPPRSAPVAGTRPLPTPYTATNTTPPRAPASAARESPFAPAEPKKPESTAPAEISKSGRVPELPAKPVPEAESKGATVSAALVPAPSVPTPVVPAGGDAPRSEAQAQKPQSVYRGPASGRLIWTGVMTAHSTVLIDGNRASRGDLTGELPNVPVRISAYPASLSRGAMNVYASQLSDEKQTPEAPGPGNGWLRTVYKRDEKRAAELTVEEVPSAQNNWQKIVLRSGNRDISAIVIDWRVSRSER